MRMTLLKPILSISLAWTLFACDNPSSTEKAVSILPDTRATESGITGKAGDNQSVQSDKPKAEIIVKNRADYSETFINGLSALGYKKFELQDSLLIIEGRDTVHFPRTPEIGKRLVLTGKKGNLSIAVTVKRINYTTIDYTTEIVEDGKASQIKRGQANIISSFFYGAESDEHEQTGVAYLVTEYSDYRENDCYTMIRLGYEEAISPYLMGKLKKNCNGQIMDITLDNFPTLIEK